MPLFNYRALDGMGVKTRGTVDAVSKTVAMDVLSDRGLFVTRIGEEHTKEEKPAVRFLPFISPVSSNEIVMLNRRLATLIGSDIPMVESLKATTNQVENRAFRRILEQVTEDVKQGHSLSNALSKHPRVFPDLMISMVRVGETGGILSSVLGQLADFTEKDKEIKAEVKTALAYPALVLTLAIATVIFLMTFILPRLAEFFMGMRVSLPLPTIMLLSISTFIQRYAVYVFIPFVVLLIGLVKWVRTSKGKRFYDSISVGIPFLGGLKRKSAIARFCRSLGALVRGGVPLMEALDVVKHILNNVPLQEALDRVQERVRKGDTMSR